LNRNFLIYESLYFRFIRSEAEQEEKRNRDTDKFYFLVILINSKIVNNLFKLKLGDSFHNRFKVKDMRSKKKNNINWGHKVKEKFDLILGLLTFISVLLFDRID
jgi:hypothetical protein